MNIAFASRRVVLFGGLLAPFLRKNVVFGCDDPPVHYRERCHAAIPRGTAYVPVAQMRGFFAENGVQQVIDAVERPDIDAAIGATPIVEAWGHQVVRAYTERQDFKVIATPLTQLSLTLWGRDSINLENLRDRKVAVANPGFGYHVALHRLLENEDLGIADVTPVAMGGASNRVQALLAGDVDAAFLPGYFERQVSGAQLIRLTSIELPHVADTFVVPNAMLDEDANVEFYASFLRAIQSALHFMLVNKQEAINDIMNYWNIDVYNAEIIYQLYLPSSDVLDIDIEGIQTVIADLTIGLPEQVELFSNIESEEMISWDVLELL